MSFELENSKDLKNDTNKNKFIKKEHKWKELLYNLFYEIKSEILNCKIEIEEEEYQENVNSTTISQLINYIHDSIQILLKKKVEDSKEKQKELDKKFYLESNLISNIKVNEDIISQYENILKKMESKQRFLMKSIFHQKLQIEAMENKIEEYMEMEDEFEEMKTKLKYEDGRFLNNDRKDNEIIIIRGENSNLKNEISKLEEKIKSFEEEKNNKDKKIDELNKQLEKLKKKIVEKQNETTSSPSININISNVNSNDNINHNETESGGGNGNSNIKNNIFNRNNSNLYNNSKFFYNYANEQISINTKKNNFSSKKKNEKNEKNIYKSYYRNKTSKDKKLLSQKIKTKLLNNKNNICDLLSTTRNESLDKKKKDLLNKYLIGIKVNKNSMNLNSSCIKVNNLTGKIYYKKKGNSSNIQSNKKINCSNGFNRNRSTSNKIKIPSTSMSHNNNVASYRSVS